MSSSLTAESTMEQVLAAYPGAQRALFRKYHIGGCSSCGFEPKETLGQLCARNGNLSVAEMVSEIQRSHEADQQMQITPREVIEHRSRGEKIRLLDLRTREEWDAVHLEGAEFVNQDLIQSLMTQTSRDGLLVFYDHTGSSSQDAAAYFAGHGHLNVRFLRGGIDAWSTDVEPALRRYRLE
jgi:rhodanese-related sulfurtransferase